MRLLEHLAETDDDFVEWTPPCVLGDLSDALPHPMAGAVEVPFESIEALNLIWNRGDLEAAVEMFHG